MMPRRSISSPRALKRRGGSTLWSRLVWKPRRRTRAGACCAGSRFCHRAVASRLSRVRGWLFSPRSRGWPIMRANWPPHAITWGNGTERRECTCAAMRPGEMGSTGTPSRRRITTMRESFMSKHGSRRRPCVASSASTLCSRGSPPRSSGETSRSVAYCELSTFLISARANATRMARISRRRSTCCWSPLGRSMSSRSRTCGGLSPCGGRSSSTATRSR